MLVVPWIFGWSLILSAPNFIFMVIGRFLQGVALGPTYFVAPLYVAEISEKETRGGLGAFFQIFLAGGILVVYTLGAFISVFWLSLACALFPLIFAATFIFFPESPHYYIIKNKFQKAEKSLKWLRSKSHDYKKEMGELKIEDEKRKSLYQNLTLRQALARPDSKKVLFIVIGLSFFQQFCGITAIIFYTTDIFQAGKSNIDPGLQTIMIAVIVVVMNFVPIFIVDKLGRKVLLIFSGLGMGISTIILGTYFFLNDRGFRVDDFEWVPLTFLSLYLISYCLGFGPVCYIVRSEICAPDIKGFVIGMALTMTWFFSFFMTKFFTNLVQALGVGPTFWMYGIFGLLSAVFVYFVLPETRGLALAEIQRMLVRTSL
jgi:SP family facilitated glucose transporter-like MFS transporter 8